MRLNSSVTVCALTTESYNPEIEHFPFEIDGRASFPKCLNLRGTVQAFCHSKPQRVGRIPEERRQLLHVIANESCFIFVMKSQYFIHNCRIIDKQRKLPPTLE